MEQLVHRAPGAQQQQLHAPAVLQWAPKSTNMEFGCQQQLSLVDLAGHAEHCLIAALSRIRPARRSSLKGSKPSSCSQALCLVVPAKAEEILQVSGARRRYMHLDSRGGIGYRKSCPPQSCSYASSSCLNGLRTTAQATSRAPGKCAGQERAACCLHQLQPVQAMPGSF